LSVVVRATLAFVLVLALTPRAIRAQPTPGAASNTRVEKTTTASDGEGWHVEQCMGGITYGAPLKLAASYGGGFLHESNNGPDVCALGVAKLGLGGAQLSAGIGSSFAPWGTGVMLTGNLLRTFAKPLHATARANYVGASLHLWPALALGGELGYYVRLGDGASAGRRVLSWSVGVGF
jgi:hypothetical protein